LFTFYAGHDSSVLFVAWSPDGKYLVSGSESGELICWDPQTGKSLGNFMQASATKSVSSSLLPKKEVGPLVEDLKINHPIKR
jgi:WD40 repeat protein